MNSHADALAENPCEADGCDGHASVIVGGEALCGACARERER